MQKKTKNDGGEIKTEKKEKRTKCGKEVIYTVKKKNTEEEKKRGDK